jgi:hypothetical protein
MSRCPDLLVVICKRAVRIAGSSPMRSVGDISKSIAFQHREWVPVPKLAYQIIYIPGLYMSYPYAS